MYPLNNYFSLRDFSDLRWLHWVSPNQPSLRVILEKLDSFLPFSECVCFPAHLRKLNPFHLVLQVLHSLVTLAPRLSPPPHSPSTHSLPVCANQLAGQFSLPLLTNSLSLSQSFEAFNCPCHGSMNKKDRNKYRIQKYLSVTQKGTYKKIQKRMLTITDTADCLSNIHS